ncbi:HNH endonuclease [Planococcus sp. APC 4015]|nr:HNH endonuclease [Planococcus sp. APC 4015]
MSSSHVSPGMRLDAAVRRVLRVFGDRDASRVVGALDDDDLLSVMTDAAAARDALQVMLSAASAEVARRSTRNLGHEGLAQRKGHRNVTSLVQNITGQSRGAVFQALQAGEDLLDAGAESREAKVDRPALPAWRGALRDALAGGQLSQEQFTAIRTGLGEPPVERYRDLDPDFLPGAWARAVDILVHEASALPVEELRAAARTARDRLDPLGVTLRFEERFAARSFRTWTDADGQRHGQFVFDDEAAAWVDAILSAALRPRRGPRFVDAAAAGEVEAAAVDDRTNEQLQYDTLIAVLRTGANADAQQAFGDRQPGVRILIDAAAICDAGARGEMQVTGVGHLEDGGTAIPGGVVEKYLCDAGAVDIDLDTFGRPLDVGREQRLFTRKQRIAIAARDGGCVWPSCTAPISWCEYHHTEHWSQDHGRTDVDDGVPLCRNCHLRLHNQKWRIARRRDPDTGVDTYWLHPPPDPRTGELVQPTRLETRSPRRFEAA